MLPASFRTGRAFLALISSAWASASAALPREERREERREGERMGGLGLMVWF